MMKFLLVFSIIGILSCNSSDFEPSFYSMKVKNQYFERIDSVQLGEYKLNPLGLEAVSESVNLKKGVFQFSCITKSSLKISATIDIQGIEPKLTLFVKHNGNITVE